MKSDEELVQLLKEEDEKAFELIFNRYFDGLCLFSESITKNHEIAEDIVEDIFVRVWANCKINPVEISIKSYLYQSAYNNSIKYISRIRKNTLRIDTLDYTVSGPGMVELQSPDYPIANLITKELEEKASEIIQSLPDQCRKVYLLNRDENLKYHEIAERLQITVGTVKTQMSRAFAKLREELKDFLYLFF
jgi:RNA polymerase sigma-70 factor, ECF subfamily